jgi:hypothetical protein
MHPALPPSIEHYFAAQNRQDGDALARCFTPTASVRDEGKELLGPAAIQAWQRDTAARYAAVATPLSAQGDGDRQVVTAKVAGNFPGSPIELAFRFDLAGDGLIERLEIG